MDDKKVQEIAATVDKLREAIGQAIGEASMCWSPRPSGVFDSSAASAIVGKTVSQIIEILIGPAKEIGSATRKEDGGWETTGCIAKISIEEIKE